ncbi:preprotein translocase subunit SecY [archaeon]|jgi:preprotein translocase subunit SecY|nr:preprotein translocase subunit SecY [archaeon]MBT6041644.1 preprotein translocase subunit SecY [Candidatus Woesearchaeota archaeon]MBT4023060.1 preprotein translocase subunit SecY [archaeon]MBT4272458.1 preprotein translocase subunit SecY [archaeon]MBT4460556.1 preprotein translocase subunit SecY [archaeon]
MFDNIIFNLPEVGAPKQKKLPFNDRLKWTLIVLVIYFLLGMIPLWPLGPNTLEQFEQLSIILGAEFGSLLSLGIGPIVTGSIILQLLNGAGIVKFDLTTQDGKRKYQGVQKLTSIFFVIFEAIIYVFMGGIAPPTAINSITLTASSMFQMKLLLVFELFLGGLIVLFMDEIVSKWGFGSGISLFIAAGISKQIFIRLFSFMDATGFMPWQAEFQATQIVGHVWRIIIFLSQGEGATALISVFTILATVIVFVVAVYAQAMKIEIPLSFGRVRGHGIRWPLQFVYTSVMPIILVSSLFATLQLWTRLLQNWTGGLIPILGGYQGGQPVGLIALLNGQNVINAIVQSGGNFSAIWPVLLNSLIYMLLMIGGAVLFSIFWVQTSGQDAESLAGQIMSSGLQIPGFRKDKRILERILSRYILPLTVMGGIVIGFLASFADMMGALSRGTGILLTVMIIYKLYEDIAREHMMDMNPMMRKFMGK